MSYCGGANTSWASDWDWNRNWQRIALFSGPDYEQKLVQEPVLHGVLGADGVEHWWTALDTFDAETISGNHEIRFDTAGRTLKFAPSVQVLSDGESLWFTVPLPADIDMRDVSLSRSFLDQSFDVQIDEGMILHDFAAKKAAALLAE